MQQAIAQLRDYDYGRPTTPLLAVEKLINETHGNRAAREQLEKDLAELLRSPVSLAAVQFVCRKLAIIGTVASVPVLQPMLASADHRVAEAACYALARHRSPQVAQALRTGLDKATGLGLAAVINLAAERRDPECAARLVELARSRDGVVADAAIAALGKVASPPAIEALSKLRGAGDSRAAHALLQAAQELSARGKTAQARSAFQQLTASSELPQIRRGALLAR